MQTSIPSFFRAWKGRHALGRTTGSTVCITAPERCFGHARKHRHGAVASTYANRSGLCSRRGVVRRGRAANTRIRRVRHRRLSAKILREGRTGSHWIAARFDWTSMRRATFPACREQAQAPCRERLIRCCFRLACLLSATGSRPNRPPATTPALIRASLGTPCARRRSRLRIARHGLLGGCSSKDIGYRGDRRES